MTSALSKVYFFLIGLFLAAPIIVVAGVSINEKQSLNFPPRGFS
ncbi:MAG: ABC transporter permease, partial [Rhizobium giardinii]